MREFNFYVVEGKIKKCSVDYSLAQSLINNVNTRENSIAELDTHKFSLLVFENYYDCLRELLDAILALGGYKSYSHEASIVYLKKFDFNESIIFDLDNFRKKRNNSRYYGKSPSQDDAKEIKDFFNKIKGDLLTLIDKIKK